MNWWWIFLFIIIWLFCTFVVGSLVCFSSIKRYGEKLDDESIAFIYSISFLFWYVLLPVGALFLGLEKFSKIMEIKIQDFAEERGWL